jgi:hypothetical protein
MISEKLTRHFFFNEIATHPSNFTHVTLFVPNQKNRKKSQSAWGPVSGDGIEGENVQMVESLSFSNLEIHRSVA